MSTVLLEPTGEGERNAVSAVPFEGVLGQRPDVRTGYGIDELRRWTRVEGGWFVYGEPVDEEDLWLPPRPDLHMYGTLSSDRLFEYWAGTNGYVPPETAMFAAGAVQKLARDPEDGRVRLFEADAFDWDENPGIQRFAERLRDLVGASEVIRDDTADTDDLLARYGTKIHLAFSGAVPFFLVERSELALDAVGREVWKRIIEAFKTFDHRTAASVANQLSLPEALRVGELMQRWQATDEQRAQVFERADRSVGQRGRRLRDRDIMDLMEQTDQPIRRFSWRRISRAVGAAVAMTADWRRAAWFERWFSGKER